MFFTWRKLCRRRRLIFLSRSFQVAFLEYHTRFPVDSLSICVIFPLPMTLLVFFTCNPIIFIALFLLHKLCSPYSHMKLNDGQCVGVSLHWPIFAFMIRPLKDRPNCLHSYRDVAMVAGLERVFVLVGILEQRQLTAEV